MSGAASVIDARFQELGGEPKVETFEHRATRVERALDYKKRREQYLGSDAGVRGATSSFASLKDFIVEAVPKLQARVPSLRITCKQNDREILLLSDGPSLSVNWRLRFSNTLNESSLDASIWLGHPPFQGVMSYEEPKSIHSLSLTSDLDPSNVHAWVVKGSADSMLMGAQEAAEYILNWWLEKVSKQKMVRS